MAGPEFPRFRPTGDYPQPTGPVSKESVGSANTSGNNPFQMGLGNDDNPFKRLRPSSTPQAAPQTAPGGAPGGINASF